MIDKQTDALKLALEDLQDANGMAYSEFSVENLYGETITAIREALAEQPPCKTGSQCTSKCPQCDEPAPVAKIAQQQEPVAWGMPSAGGGFVVDCITPEEHARIEGGYTVPLYTSPHPSKPWAGLTYGEVLEQKKDDPIQFYRAIEAKLREKNNG